MLTIASVNDSVLDLIGHTPLVDVSQLSPNPDVRILAKLESQNPFGSVKDRIAKAMIEDAEKHGHLQPGPDHRRAVVGQHRHRPRRDRPDQGLPDQDPAARERVDRAPPDARGVRRRDHPHARRRGVERGRQAGQRAGRRAPRVVLPLPVRQRRQPACPLRGHRPGDLAGLPGDHPLRRRARHERHADGHGALPQGAEPRHQGDRHRAAARRARRGPAQPRGGLHPAGVRPVVGRRPPRPQARRAAARVDRVDPPARRDRRVRRAVGGCRAGRRGEGRRRRSTGAPSCSSSATAAGSTCRRAPTPTTSMPPRPTPRVSSTSEARSATMGG